ncbi:MAG TPA: hypothetical protein DCF63_01370 [Planctomycetaceae bacterium]|nr:hypothetical protein [Planctomycetaceae bacterium]
MNRENSIIRIARFQDELSASLCASRLMEQGIRANVVGGELSGFRAGSPTSVEVFVDARLARQARDVLKDLMIPDKRAPHAEASEFAQTCGDNVNSQRQWMVWMILAGNAVALVGYVLYVVLNT